MSTCFSINSEIRIGWVSAGWSWEIVSITDWGIIADSVGAWINEGIGAPEAAAADSGNDAVMRVGDVDGLESWLVDFEDFRS